MARVVYCVPGMSDPQRRADEIRNRVEEHEATQRVALEVLWATGTPHDLTVRARHHDRVLTLERGPGWLSQDPTELALGIAHELVTQALGTDRPTVPPPLWRRGVSQAPPAT